MMKDGGLAVHDRRGRANRAARLLDDSLMSKAYSEQRQIAPGEADQLQVAAGIGRAARAGREDDEGLAAYRDIEGTARLDMAPHHLHASPQPLETLGEIEAEAVEMIDQEEAGLHRAAPADATAIRTADALRRVSSASPLWSESCTPLAPARPPPCPTRPTAAPMPTAPP